MPPLVDRVRRALERDALIPPGGRLVAAVSGGSDSVALLHVLRELAPALGFTLAGVAHLNHLLRGDESDADEAFCRVLAGSLDLPIEIQQIDVGTLAAAQRVSVEVAARRARYRFLERAALRLDADMVATGHTRNDQAETFLLRLLRGAGATGLAAIPPRRGMFVRPLLDERREDLRAFLAERAIAFREDATNADTRIPRNWVRHELLPFLAARLGSDTTDLLAREAAVLRDDAAMLDAVAEEAARRIVRLAPDGALTMSAAELESLPPALARRVIRRALAQTSPAFQGAAHVDRVLDLARAGGNTTVDLPGVRLERNGGDVVLSTREGRGARRQVAFRYALPVPGRVVIHEAESAIETGLVAPSDAEAFVAEHSGDARMAAAVDAAVAAGGLWVRSRKPGDAYRPFGPGGRKKLQDVFVDRKVPREQRDRVPIVVDAGDRIVWVAGVGPSEDARVTGNTQSVVTFELSRLGDTG